MLAPPSFWTTGVLSVDPVVTYTKRHPPTPIGLAGASPELFSGRRSLHLVTPCWTLYAEDIAEMAQELRRLSAILPQATIVFLANTDDDALLLNNAGVPAILGNSAIFVDERAFKPLPAFDFSDAAYDAIYNARFEAYKRHSLAREVDRLALIYDARFDGSTSPLEQEVRRTLSRARFLNHELGNGAYAAMNKEAITRELNRARCGLCLSRVEGSARVSMEYLLCGLPVVSTHSTGGRDRYYLPEYTTIVSANPEAVRAAVDDMVGRKFNKLAIRSQVGAVVEFERSNLLTAVNALVREHLGAKHLFEDLKPFIEANPFTEPMNDWSRQRLLPVAEALGRTLAPIPAGNSDAELRANLPPVWIDWIEAKIAAHPE